VSTLGRLDQDMAEPGTGPDETPDETPEQSAAPRRDRRTTVISVLAAAVLVLTALVFYRFGSRGASPASAAVKPSASVSASATPNTAQIYQAVGPSVVTILATRPGGQDLGAGVIVNADGTVLTALHVVKNAAAIQLTFADGTRSPGAVTASDPTIDIATVTPATLPSIVVPAVLGSAGRLAVGDNVVAIGNPLGLTLSTTTGVVSGLNRTSTESGGVSINGLIQFDAAVNPGSSGGPLLDGRGETVGIVVALANPTSDGTFIGVGFAVPIGTAVQSGGGGRNPQQ
jgi:S1-C subfamily serine protease